MEEDHVTDKQEASSDVSASPQNHHPRKLPNIPRNPEIYEPSPGIFKYIRKDSKITVPSSSSSTTLLKDSTRISLVNSSTNSSESLTTNKPSNSYTDTESEEMLMELECYDEAGPSATIFQQLELVEPVPNLATNPPGLNANPGTLSTSATSSGTDPPQTGASVFRPGYNHPKFHYRPLKPVGPVLNSSSQPDSADIPLSSDVTEIYRCMPNDRDEFDTLKGKLNRAMQLYTMQRRQIVKLNGRVKNLARANERLSERARQANAGTHGGKRPNPCLATDTKYVILFENLINPEAMNTITSAMSTAEKLSG